MKKIALLAVGGAALISVAVLAHAQSQQGMQPHMQMQGGPGMVGGMMHAQNMGPGMGMHGGSDMHGNTHGQPKGDSGPSSLAFNAINEKMHEDMDITYTGNTDVDFVRGMIPHHQGAVDMAKTLIAFGKDPELKKLAEQIIKAQETEIAFMKEWLKKNGG
ncbi:MAG TPA: DUF305 domain-containing protein [Xanthobacteraceae bacterium]|nr:DUF305 domain-containing protein [Xanthobacteraceae bacterium]